MGSTKWTYNKEWSFASKCFHFSKILFQFKNPAWWVHLSPTTQMSIFILFESAWVFFEGAFSLWVSLIETLVHHKPFPKIFFLSQVLLGTYSKKTLCWSLLIAELQSVRCRFATLPDVFLRIFQTFTINYFS